MSALRILCVVLVVLAFPACSGKQSGHGDAAGGLEAQLGALPPNSGPGATLRRSRILRALGRQDQALTELSAAADAERERLDWAMLTALWREVGEIHLEQGHPQEALEAFGKRLKTAAALEKQVERARALVDTGYALSLMGSMSRADEAIGEAELLASSDLTQDPATAERLALTLERLSFTERASQLLGRAQQGYDALGDGAGAARSAVYRAALVARAENSGRALDDLGAVVERSADPEPRLRWLRFQAEASLEAHDYAKCEKQAEEAVTLADKRGIQPVAKLGRVVLARCAAEAGHLDQAIRRAEEAGFLAEDQRQHLTGDQARQEAGFEAFLIYRLLLSLQVKLPEGKRAAAAFVTAERARARAHLDALMRSRAAVAGPLGDSSSLLLHNKEEAEAQLRRLTADLTQHRGEPGMAERHRNALWALEDIKDALSQQNPLLSRIEIPRPATPAQVRETMLSGEGGDALLVSYFVGEEQVVAIAIDKSVEKLFVLKSSPETLSKNLRAFKRGVLLDSSRGMPEVKEAGARLYQDLLGPLDALVKAHKGLIVIPHGELGSIPFEALVDPQGKFLVEGHDVSYSLSATLGVELAKAKPAAKGRKGFVGLGDPVYDWASFKASRTEGSTAAASRGLSLWIDASALSSAGEAKPAASQGLPRLPGTAAELKAIAKLFGSDQTLYLRDQATEENVKAGVLGGHRIVHIASHGLLEPHYQALALSLNPDSKEDGFLLHSEIVDLKLDADLVVLSACQTGNTFKRSAEPVAGLALALRSAGARRVVVSLWSVDDEATAKLMTDFYRPLVKEGASYGASLADAKRKMLAHGPSHPYYWAPFVLLGN